MFIHVCYSSGFVAERVNLRYFLALGMITSGIFTYLFGLAKSYGIHYMWYFTLIQVKESFVTLVMNIAKNVCVSCTAFVCLHNLELVNRCSCNLTFESSLTLRLLMSYIYGAPSKARNANVVYIWTYVWQH